MRDQLMMDPALSARLWLISDPQRLASMALPVSVAAQMLSDPLDHAQARRSDAAHRPPRRRTCFRCPHLGVALVATLYGKAGCDHA